MKKSKTLALFVVVIIITLLLFGCTENKRAKTFGGTSTIDLPKDTKLITVTWKGEQIWYLTRERRVNEPIESYRFKEESSYGFIQGTVILKEN